jgi:hypothetical protein
VLGALAVVVLGLVLDATSDSAPAPRASFSERDVARVAHRVERLRGLRFVRPVRPLFLDRDEALAFVDKVSREDYSQRERRVDEESLKLLGLLPAATDVDDVLERVGSEQLLGFYDDHSKRLVVIRDASATRPLLEITLAHELVHALEDQHFHLNVPEGVPDDSVLARSALAEGTATSLMVDYAKRYMSVSDVLSFASVGESEGLPPFFEKQLLFPYLQGQKFVDTFRGAHGSWKPIDSIYRFRMPRSSDQILHPRDYADDKRPRLVRLPDVRPVLGPGWQRLRSVPLGEYDVQLLIDIGRGARPAAGADGWAGGRYELWRQGSLDDGCKAPCASRDVAVVRLEWDTARDRREAEQQLALVWRRRRDGAVAMQGRGRTLVAVLAPDEGLAARTRAISLG